MIEPTRDPEQLAVHTLRMLAADAVEQARSGHPGMPMGMADGAFVLFQRFLRHDPTRPDWPGRDRFVLSAGHGSALLYALLHLYGYGVSLDDLKRFRQWGSCTPGHPERGCAPGVEMTTGPLGQGFATGVGLALASSHIHERLGGGAFSPADWRVWAIVSDGDLMEGVASEAASLAGHLRLGKLVYLYDDNRISIEGSTELSFGEDVAGRFEAYGWHVQKVDGHDRQALAAACEAARDEIERPSLICARTHIAYGSPGKQDSADSHGAPLGADELRETKRALGWPEEPAFFVPDEARALVERRRAELASEREAWEAELARWKAACPDGAALWEQLSRADLPAGLLDELIEAAAGESAATRALSGKVLQRAAKLVPGLLGGSADLAPSNKTAIKDGGSVAASSFGGRNIHFGVREHAMGAMLNGMALAGLVPYGGTFLVFADYLRPAIRLAALMELGAIYVLTHDSIFVGEDGPTHQPIEQLASLRCIPGLAVYRPADALETAAGWTLALRRRRGPTALVLSRQKLPALERPAGFRPDHALQGAYVLVPEREGKRAVVVASGSELAPAAAAARELGVRAVSMPSVECFFELGASERDAIVPAGWKVAVVEASRDPGWARVAGRDGLVIGMQGFGASAPGDELGERFGLDAGSIQRSLADWLAG
ncbi:MAG: transketolase [Deltaproteobacteria bacterium]|nr:transketolase [Deltaproteobacteria bacterium]